MHPVRLAVAPLLRCQTDERLLELARAGHESAFEAIVERYRRPLLRYCGRLLSPGRAEDAVQQTFLGAYRVIRDGEGDVQLRPWLYRAAHNASVDAMRQNASANGSGEKSLNGIERADESWKSREDLRDLLDSLRALPPRQRDAIVLRELEGRGHDEIASMLGLSESAARQLIHRARCTLRTGASALAPSGLLHQLLTILRADPAPSRISELVAGGGTAAAMAKVGAAGLVAGAIAVSGAHQPASGGERGTNRLAAEGVASPLSVPVNAGVARGPDPLAANPGSPAAQQRSAEGHRAGRREDETAVDRVEREHIGVPSIPQEPQGHRGEGFTKGEDPDGDGDFAGDRSDGHSGAEDEEDGASVEAGARARDVEDDESDHEHEENEEDAGDLEHED